MNESYFAMAFHLHQPIGNFDEVIEGAYNKCYKPFLNVFSKYPQIKINLHISGCLIDYFEARHPEFLDKIDKMCKRGQLELLGGGYYEPILIAIPENDLSGQIEMMARYIKSRFGQNAKGIWITERVWRPDLVTPLSKAGVKYCILDDTHLTRGGVSKDKMYGFFSAVHNSSRIMVFPSDKKLRYIIPFSEPHEVIKYFREVSDKHHRPLFVYGDDGEKFGEWPGTHKWVFEERWLEKFLNELSQNSGWLKTAHLSQYLSSHAPLEKIKIPEASYDEMIEWAGGSWLNFLSMYPEANQMHKKMLYVSGKIEKAQKAAVSEPEKIKAAKEELYKGQCNCGYWHGVFGGLYLYHLRYAVYNHLIAAEKIINEVLYKKERKNIEQLDFDRDGKDEGLLESKEFFVYIKPADGGVIKELDYRPLSLNLVNTLSRREESYHKKILEAGQAKHGGEIATIHDDFRKVNPELKNGLVYDKFQRSFLRAYFVKKDLALNDFINSSFEELGGFASGDYILDKKNDCFVLTRESCVLSTVFTLSKKIHVKSKKEIEVEIEIKNKGVNTSAKNVLFGIEFNLTMPQLNAGRYHYYFDKVTSKNLNTRGSSAGFSRFGIKDNLKELSVYFNVSKKPEKIWFFPVKTVSQSERAYEFNYQSSCVFPLWQLGFDKKRVLNFNINIIMDS